MRHPLTPALFTRTAGVLVTAALLLTGCSATVAEEPSDAASAAAHTADATLHAMLPQRIQDAGVVKVASDVPYPPFEFFDTDGSTIIGSDVELAAALGDVLGVEFDFEAVAFDNIIPGLSSGKYDAAMSGMADRKERQANATFVDYMTNRAAFLVVAGGDAQPTSMDELCGLKVGAQAATTMAEDVTLQADVCIAAGEDAPILSQFQGQDDAILALRSGRIDVVDLTAGSGSYVVTQTGDEFEISGADESFSVLGIAVQKDDMELAEAIQAALQQLMDDGTYESILDSWGLYEFNSVEKTSINGAVN